MDIPDFPESAADKKKEDKQIDPIQIPIDGPYIHNIYANKEWLTIDDAIILINSLSGSILIDAIRRGKSKETNKKYL
ncbi:MAG: hypothetical protein ACM34O_10930 [Ignavibacteria bacterium]